MKKTLCITLSIILFVFTFSSCKSKSYIYRKICEEYYSDGKLTTRIEYKYNEFGLLFERNTEYLLMNTLTNETYQYEGSLLSSLSVTDETGNTEIFSAVGDKFNQSFYYQDGSLYKVMQYDENENLIVEAFGENNVRTYEYAYDNSGKIISVKKNMLVPSGSEKVLYYSCTYNTTAFNYILTDIQDGMKNNTYTAVYYEKIEK